MEMLGMRDVEASDGRRKEQGGDTKNINFSTKNISIY